MLSKKFPELPRCQSRVLGYAAHRERVNGVVPWDGQDSLAIGHDDMLALPRDIESGLLESLDGSKVRDTRYLRHALRRDVHFPQILAPS